MVQTGQMLALRSTVTTLLFVRGGFRECRSAGFDPEIKLFFLEVTVYSQISGICKLCRISSLFKD